MSYPENDDIQELENSAPKPIHDQTLLNAQTDEEELEEVETVTETKPEPPLPRQEHTAKNTCAGEVIETVWKELGIDPDAIGSIPVFLGTKKEIFNRNVKMMTYWVEYKAAVTALEQDRLEMARFVPIENRYKDFREKHYGMMSDEEFENFFEDFIRFSQDSVEDWEFKAETNYSRNWQNRTMFAKGLVEADCQPRFPGRNGKFSFAQKMERSSARSSEDPLTFDVLIRDSFVQLRVKRTSLLELGDLIESINREIMGYVRRLNGNSLTLARVAMYRVFWRHLVNKIESCSVKGINDFRELGNIIKFNNLNEIFVKFIQEVSRSGAPFTLYCTEDKCGWQETKSIDPSILKHFDPSVLVPAQLAAIANIRNGVKTYSKEEILKLQKKSKFVEDNRIYFDEGRQYITVEAPTVNEAFASYDVFMSFMEPRIDALRENYVDDEKYLEQLDGLLDTYRSMEFVHWVGSLHIIDEANEEEVFRRSENPVEFVEGIIPILNKPESTKLSTDLIKFVLSNGARMVSTIVGVDNFACPKCSESSGKTTGVKGITPVDPFTCFFILSRFELAKRAMKMGLADAEAL